MREDRRVTLTVCSIDRGLGAVIAQKFAAEGCNVAINYVSNLNRAKETASTIEKDHKVKTFLIQGVSRAVRIKLSSVYMAERTAGRIVA